MLMKTHRLWMIVRKESLERSNALRRKWDGSDSRIEWQHTWMQSKFLLITMKRVRIRENRMGQCNAWSLPNSKALLDSRKRSLLISMQTLNPFEVRLLLQPILSSSTLKQWNLFEILAILVSLAIAKNHYHISRKTKVLTRNEADIVCNKSEE